LGSVVRDANNVLGGLDEEADDFEVNLAANKLDEGSVVTGDVDERVGVPTGVGCVEVGLGLLLSGARGVQGEVHFHRGDKALNRHGKRRGRRQWGAVLHDEDKVSVALQNTTSDNGVTRRAEARKETGSERDDVQVWI